MFIRRSLHASNGASTPSSRRAAGSVSSPRKQTITTTYRMPVADCVERIRAVSQAIQPRTSGPSKPEHPAHRQPQQRLCFQVSRAVRCAVHSHSPHAASAAAQHQWRRPGPPAAASAASATSPARSGTSAPSASPSSRCRAGPPRRGRPRAASAGAPCLLPARRPSTRHAGQRRRRQHDQQPAARRLVEARRPSRRSSATSTPSQRQPEAQSGRRPSEEDAADREQPEGGQEVRRGRSAVDLAGGSSGSTAIMPARGADRRWRASAHRVP